MAADLATLREWLKRRVTAPEFREFLAESLLGMCRIDTIPTRDLADTAAREGRVFGLLEELIRRHRLQRDKAHAFGPLPDEENAHPFSVRTDLAGGGDYQQIVGGAGVGDKELGSADVEIITCPYTGSGHKFRLVFRLRLAQRHTHDGIAFGHPGQDFLPLLLASCCQQGKNAENQGAEQRSRAGGFAHLLEKDG